MIKKKFLAGLTVSLMVMSIPVTALASNIGVEDGTWSEWNDIGDVSNWGIAGNNAALNALGGGEYFAVSGGGWGSAGLQKMSFDISLNAGDILNGWGSSTGVNGYAGVGVSDSNANYAQVWNSANGAATWSSWSYTAQVSGVHSLQYYHDSQNWSGAVYFDTSTPVFTRGVSELAAVPVPAAAWLFGSGLLGLVGVARRKTA